MTRRLRRPSVVKRALAVPSDALKMIIDLSERRMNIEGRSYIIGVMPSIVLMNRKITNTNAMLCS